MKFVCINTKPFKILVCVAICFIVASCMVYKTASASVYAGYSNRLLPIYGVETDEKKVAITFDAAYGSDETVKIINILKEKNVTATFFLVGFWVDKYPELVKTLDSSGIEIGTHSNTHPYMSKLSAMQMNQELTTSIEKITALTGKPVTLFRPPYGDYNDTLIKVSADLNIFPIQWSVDSLDWKGLNTSQMMARITPNVENGSIILFHNNSDHIVEALPVIIDTLTEQGYTLVHVSDLIYHENYTINNNGIQIKNN